MLFCLALVKIFTAAYCARCGWPWWSTRPHGRQWATSWRRRRSTHRRAIRTHWSWAHVASWRTSRWSHAWPHAWWARWAIWIQTSGQHRRLSRMLRRKRLLLIHELPTFQHKETIGNNEANYCTASI